MRTPVMLTLSLLASSMLPGVPTSMLGKWTIGQPFVDMKPQPIGIDARQERKLLGTKLEIGSTSLSACGSTVPIVSAEVTTYSADRFLQKYEIRPDQIGLNAPLTMYSFHLKQTLAICGIHEGFALLIDGNGAALEVANAYFHLNKMKTAR